MQHTRQRWVSQPAGHGKFAHEQGRHDQRCTHGCHPEAEVVQERKRHIACANLQRNQVVHQAGDQRHGHEENHDHAVGRENLIVVVRRQETFIAVEGNGLLGTHHDRIGKATHHHDQAQHHVHDADLLVVNAGEPVVPQSTPQAIFVNHGQ